MSVFPAQYSTLSSLALKDFLAEAYGFTWMTCRLLVRNVSDTYILEGNEAKYIFKIYRDAHRKLDEIKAEVELLNVLHQKGASVSYPITDVRGRQVQQFNAAEGTRYGVLFSYACGEVVYNLNNEQLQLLGQQMALVHNITENLELKHPRKAYTIETTITNPLIVIAPAFDNLQSEYAYLNETAIKVIENISRLKPADFSYGYCHYDFLPKNFHFAGNDKLTFFDFDFAGNGYLVNDLMTFYIHYFLEENFGKITKQQATRCFNVFLESYRKVRHLSDKELDAIPYLGFAFWVFYLGFQYENFDDWSNIFFSDKFVKDRVALIKKWMDSFDLVNK